MDYNKPWGWSSNGVSPNGNFVSPLSASAASMPATATLPPDQATKMLQSAGGAVAGKAIDNFLKPAAPVVPIGVVQDSATKGALYGTAGYGPPMGADAAQAGLADAGAGAAADVGSEAASVAADVGTAAVDAGSSFASSVLPYAGVLKSVADGDYGKAAMKAAATTMLGPLGGLAVDGASRWLGFADGTTSVGSPLANRAAAGARFSPELFGAGTAQGGKGGASSSPTVPAQSSFGSVPAQGGKGGATAGPSTLPAQSIVKTPASQTMFVPPALQLLPWQAGDGR